MKKKIVLLFFFLALSTGAFAAVCNNFERIYAQDISGVTLANQARLWDRNGFTIKTLKQSTDSNFSCIGKWGEEIKLPVFAGEALKYRGSGDDALVFDYIKEDETIGSVISITDQRFNGLKLELLDVNVSQGAIVATIFPENGFIRFKAENNACESNELFLSVCACTNDCSASGARECTDKTASPNSFRVCGDFDDDPCFEWGAPQLCPTRTPSCDANANCAEKCKNECVPGKKECVNAIDKPNLFRECGNFDDDPCFEWGKAETCPESTPSCDINGSCTSICNNDCPASGAKKCTNTIVEPNLFETCANFDFDPCLEWGLSQSCPELKAYCDSNANCNCIDDCPKKGFKECVEKDVSPNSFRICDNSDRDTCLEWGPAKTCTFNYPLCDANANCVSECTSECTPRGKRECVETKAFPNTFRVCGDTDNDICFEWLETQACPESTPSCDVKGECVLIECKDECSVKGARKCEEAISLPNTFKECGNFDNDACLEYSNPQPCPKTSPACTGQGECIQFCFNECEEKGEKQCVDRESYPNTIRECGNFDDDPCFEWGKAEECPEPLPACSEENKCIALSTKIEREKDLLSTFFELLKSIFRIFGIK